MFLRKAFDLCAFVVASGVPIEKTVCWRHANVRNVDFWGAKIEWQDP